MFCSDAHLCGLVMFLVTSVILCVCAVMVESLDLVTSLCVQAHLQNI